MIIIAKDYRYCLLQMFFFYFFPTVFDLMSMHDEKGTWIIICYTQVALLLFDAVDIEP